MKRLLSRLGRWRLQHILVLAFALTTAVTIMVGMPVTYSVIDSYLSDAMDGRVARDMDLADAFYALKLGDISSTAGRIASLRSVRHNLAPAGEGLLEAVEAIESEIENELSNLPPDAQRFIIVTDPEGQSITGRVACDGHCAPAEHGKEWNRLPIVQSVLTTEVRSESTEVIPADILQWVGLDGQAEIALLDTPRAVPDPYDPREGTAGLTLVGAAPVFSEEGELLGSVLAGHLFNNDFTLVDRIKDVAGVDTATIFFGDLRVSTNVPLDEEGNRAIGTRVSQEVFDTVLVNGEEFTGDAFVVNQDYITRYRPLHDHAGNVVGMLYVGANKSAFQQLLDSFRGLVFLIAGASILLAILIAIPLAWSISRPLTGLARATQQVAEGDWSVRSPEHGYQEMRTLAKSFNTMVEALEETREELVQKEKLASVGQLAAGVAHEINNPLGSVLLYADILHKETPEEETQQRKDLDMIIREAKRCKAIVNDLLNFSRQNEILAQETDLNAILEELAVESRVQESFQAVRIETDLDPNLPAIQADPLQLHQVFLNLMTNGAEAMPDGGRLTLRTRTGPMPGFVTVEVQDTGVGIPDENMKKVFTPFFTTKPIGKGTGLGLAIIYGIVKMHRGQISVASDKGIGTTFTLTLRVKLPAQDSRPEGSFVVQ
jgi:two-component system NtrC family sensor kinase